MAWLISFVVLVVSTALAPGMTAAAFATLGSTLLGMAAKLLDVSLYSLVAKFDVIIYGSLAPIINQLWTVFRDISNIIIIGMFTFIALTMILGISRFNARHMVAKVLLIAVLLNFSLLFTRLIIASSNFVAGQFYCSMIANTGQSGVCGAGTSPGVTDVLSVASSDKGIGREFMKFLGADDFTTARETANSIWRANNIYSANFFALLYGLTAAVLMIAAALVFAYAVFLIVARSILFIFLLVLSAPAFAAYLVPKYGQQYWSMWWESLLRNAIFGPFLMMLLWATFLTSRGLAESVGGQGSFDALFTNQASGSGYLAMLVFAIILGMLYASVRFASKFASSIHGFDWATMLPGAAVALGGGLGGILGRNTYGRYAYGKSKDIQKQIDEEKQKRNPNYGLISSLSSKKAAWDARAARDYNFMNIKKGGIGDRLAGALGVSGTIFDGKSKGGGYGGRVKEGVKSRAEEYRSAVMTQEEVTKRLEHSRREAEERRTRLEEQRSAARDAAREQREAKRDEREAAQREQRDAEAQTRMIETERSRAAQEHDREIGRLKEERDRAEQIHGVGSTEAQRANSEHQAALNERGAVIQRAQQEAERRAGGSLQQFTRQIEDARARVSETSDALRDLSEQDRIAEQEHKTERDRLKQQARDDERQEATRIKEYHEGLVQKITSKTTLNKDVAEGIVKEISATGTVKRLKDKIDDLSRRP